MKRGRRKHESDDGGGGDVGLNDLPESLLLHIMSFMVIKDAVRTCILSRRWKGLWKCMPSLALHAADFNNHADFSGFVSGIVSCRDGDHPLLSLDFSRHGYFLPRSLLSDLMAYAVSHKIQQLKINVPFNLGLPSFVFSCRSLSSLDISVSSHDVKTRTRIPRSLELPALVSLRLEAVAFSTDDDGCADPFSPCKMLNTLTIDYPVLLSASGTLAISNASLANLTIDDYSTYEIVVSAPSLTSFTLNGCPFQKLQGRERARIKSVALASLLFSC